MRILIFLMITISFPGCSHNHEHSETMKKVVDINVKLWEDLNSAKSDVKNRLSQAKSSAESLDSLGKAGLSSEMNFLAEQMEALKELDQLIPEIKGYEPKCNHEPGEPHEHNEIDIAGISEEDLLENHQELRKRLDKVISALKE